MKNRRIKLICLSVCVFFLSTVHIFAAGKKNTSKSVLDIYNQAVAYENDGNYYLASQYYLDVTRENPAFSEAWFRLAQCSYRIGEFDLALYYLETSEVYDKDSRKISNLKGEIYIALGRIEEAAQILNDILKKYPNDVDAHFGLAEIELLQGRFSGAENQYAEALKRQNNNRKALLSMALVCAEKDKFDESEDFLRRALQYYSGEAEVHYFSAVINSMQGDYVNAEKQARIAVEVNGNYEAAYDLLSMVLYQQGRYSEVIDISDFLISRNRNNTNAWYVKGIALCKMGRNKEAIDVWTTGLNINPQDEIMRFNLEMEVRDLFSLEDKRRSIWAKYHVENARQYATHYDGSGSVYEYQRALLLDPMNFDARYAYAEILEMNGMHELYLDQLKFIKDHNYDSLSKKLKTELDDKIEAYDSLLVDTLATKWNVEPFYLDKTRWNIAVFYEENNSSFIHADSNRLVSKAAADIFSGVAITSVKTQVTPVTGFGDAFRNARAGKFDYFIILSISEGANDLTLTSQVYSARTGLKVLEDSSFYSTGNNRFSTVLRRFRNSVLEKLSVKGKILARNGNTVLIDLGKTEKIVKDAQFKIIKKGCVHTVDSDMGISYKDDDVLGTITVTQTGEEISEAEIDTFGFYDRINIGDEVVLISMPEVNTESNGEAIDTVPVANESGEAVVPASSVNGEDLVSEIQKAVIRPSILDLIKNIY